MSSSTQVKSFRAMIGVPPSTASVSDSTLVIIDAQNEYADGLCTTVNVAQTRAAIASLLQKYRSSSSSNGSKKNIVHVLQDTPPGAPVFTPETPLAEEFAELAPQKGEHVIHKAHPSCFADTDLDEYLKGLPEAVNKKVVLVGYQAHLCVSTTARAAAERGLDVVLVEDAIGDRDIPGVDGEEVKRVALRELGDAFGTVLKGVGEVN